MHAATLPRHDTPLGYRFIVDAVAPPRWLRENADVHTDVRRTVYLSTAFCPSGFSARHTHSKPRFQGPAHRPVQAGRERRFYTEVVPAAALRESFSRRTVFGFARTLALRFALASTNVPSLRHSFSIPHPPPSPSNISRVILPREER